MAPICRHRKSIHIFPTVKDETMTVVGNRRRRDIASRFWDVGECSELVISSGPAFATTQSSSARRRILQVAVVRQLLRRCMDEFCSLPIIRLFLSSKCVFVRSYGYYPNNTLCIADAQNAAISRVVLTFRIGKLRCTGVFCQKQTAAIQDVSGGVY